MARSWRRSQEVWHWLMKGSGLSAALGRIPYRCSLPGLTRFDTGRCTGPEPFIGQCRITDLTEMRRPVQAFGGVINPDGRTGGPGEFNETSVSVLSDAFWMHRALALAAEAVDHGDVPVGALVVHNGAEIGRGCNRREVDRDPLAHAELLAIHAASTVRGEWRLSDCTLYVTLEPCAMCAGALVNSRISTLVYAAADPKAGYCGSLGNLIEDPRLNHHVEVRHGMMADASRRLLRRFFAGLRAQRQQLRGSRPPNL